MSSKLRVEEINRLAIEGHKIVSITDIEGSN
jgi:predicted transcriptional regulator of viral defense system